MEPQRTLTDLPFEVLDLIYKALALKPHFGHRDYVVYDYSADKLSLAQASEYLGQAFAYHSRDAYKEAMHDYIHPRFPERAWSVILPLCGSKVVEYNGCCYSAVVAKEVAQYCPNLQTVKFAVDEENSDILLSVIDNAKSAIRTMEFQYYFGKRSSIIPNIMPKFPVLPFLRKLTLDQGKIDDAYEIPRFLNIEELSLHKPFPTCDEELWLLHLFKLCAPLKKLRSLTVSGVHFISETDEDERIPPFPVLERLELLGCVISVEFPNCPKLKILNLLRCKSNIEGLLCRLVLNQDGDLERLTADCRPSQFDNDSLLEVIRKFRKLRYFDVPIRKIKFHLELVNEMLNALKENGVTQADPLELTVDEYSKIHWLRRWLSYNSNSNLIKICEY